MLLADGSLSSSQVQATGPGGVTLSINAAQEGLRRMDPHGGGFAWVFDAVLRDP